MEELAPILATATIFSILGWMLRTWLNHRRQVKLFQVQSEMHSRLLDKFGSSTELLEYLKTEAGSQLVQTASVEPTSPFRRILASIQVGIIVAMAGAGFLFLGLVIDDPDTRNAFMILAGLGLSVGIGFTLSGAAAYRLSRSWGLISPGGAGDELDELQL
jgi:hypothetical protein